MEDQPDPSIPIKPGKSGGDERRDAVRWIVLTALGLAVTYVAVRGGAKLGTASAPFLGSYRLHIGAATLLAPAVAVATLWFAARGGPERVPWWQFVAGSYGAALAWTLSLAVVDGAAGLTRSLLSADEYHADLADVGNEPLAYLRTFTDDPTAHSDATRGHPPGPVLFLWALQRVGLTDRLALGVLITALGALAVPLILIVVKGVSGETTARRYALVLVLAPWAVWLAVSMDAVVALLGALLVAAGERASAHHRTGWTAFGWSIVAGLLVGVAALFSYAAPWLGLSVVLLYFARRRPFLNVGTGLGALVPLLGAWALGFSWMDGLLTAQADHLARIEPHRSAVWWAGISLVALLLAAGPALVASARKVRNTPGWPFLLGATIAVVSTVVAGLARGGVEHAWLPFFPWLTLAAVAPERQAGPPVPAPLLLAGIGAGVAVVIEAVLATAW